MEHSPMEHFKPEKSLITPFSLIGISVKTNNNDIIKLTKDMQQLWNKFISEDLITQIPNKVDNTIYCVYTDYEGDHTMPYLAILGCKVSSSEEVPHGFISRNISGGSYNKYTAKGNILHGAVANKWKRIWQSNIQRAYTADFEVYGAKSQNLDNAEVDIFVGIK